MGYTGLKPADTQTIAQGPADIRDEIQGLATGQVVNAGTLKGYVPGNASGNIAVSNGTVCTGLNADKLDGNDASAFAAAGHTHAAATTSSNGLMSNTDKTKLDGIAAGAEVNQNSFGNIAAGGVTIQADAKSDTLSFAAGTGVTLSGNATTDTVTITVTQDGHSHAAATTGAAGFMAAADKSKLDGIAAGAEVNQNAFSTVVAGGASIAADGKADTLTINAGSGITIAGDATNDALSIAVTPNGHTHSDASTGAAGFVTPAMVTKLNGIAAGAQTNQSAFSNVLVGGTTIAADAATDTLELIAGSNIALTPNATNDSVTIGVIGTIATASTLATARTINGVSFNGSANITIADATKLPLTGGTITGDVVVPTGNRNTGIFGTYDSTKTQHIWSMGTAYKNAADGSNFGNLYGLAYKYGGPAGGHGVYLVNNGVAYCGIGTNLWTSGTVYEAGTALNTRYLGISANAASAAKLATARTISLTGDVTGSASFDGSTNASITATVVNDSHSHTASTLPAVRDSVAVISGTIAHGTLLPLPAGFTAAQCTWIISRVRSGWKGTVLTGNAWDDDDDEYCYVDDSRIVQCYHYNGSTLYPGTANYLVMGVK